MKQNNTLLRSFRILTATSLLGFVYSFSSAQEVNVDPVLDESTIDPTSIMTDDVFENLENLAQEGALPQYSDLLLPSENAVELAETYLQSMPVMQDDYLTTDVVFADIPEDSFYRELTLIDLLSIAEENNFSLINSRRGVEIAESNVREDQGFFVPFVDLVSDARVFQDRDEDAVAFDNASRRTKAVTRGYDLSTGLEVTQNLPTGGAIVGDFTESVANARTEQANGIADGRTYGASTSLRYTQPLLRGSGLLTGQGTDIGTVNLRQSRLSNLRERIANQLDERDIYLRVISNYFNLLQFKQQLLVSRDAIRERYRFLDETRIKYSVGRVAESEILRAQIQFLQEIERAIGRQQNLDDAREGLLNILGLPLDTPISLIDITTDLADRGRFDIPDRESALSYARNNRLELQLSDISIKQSEISQQVAVNNILADLDFDVGVSAFDSDRNYGQGHDFDNDSIDAGISLRIPLSNRIADRENIRQARLSLEQAKTNRISLERDLDQDVLTAHRGVLTTEARLTVLTKQVEQARRNLELINGSFEVGFASITEVRLAQDDLFDAETAFKNAVLGYQVNIAQLYVAMGLPLR